MGVNIGIGVGLELSLGYVVSGILCHPQEPKDKEANMSFRDFVSYILVTFKERKSQK